MTIPFGPQLIGQTEKTLNALLMKFLEGTDLTEPQWVTLRIASQVDRCANARELATVVADKARFEDAAELIEELTRRGLLAGGRMTEAGSEVVAKVTTRIQDGGQRPPIWADLDELDVVATTRVLNTVLERTRANVAALSKRGV